MIRDRVAFEATEARTLAFFACPSVEATRRLPLAEDPLRTSFQRDRDRILHSRAFRRLKHKTQVYVPHTGDHPRTRLTHTLEVAQIGRTIARALGLNEDLVEATALAHDLGHTAFGHSGERVLRRILAGEEPGCPLPDNVRAEVGSFKHNYQSIRVVDCLERRYPHPGLNLTDQVREGVLKHTTWKTGFDFPLPDPDGLRLGLPCHLEGQVVALADEIAQQTHDLEDGVYAEAIELEAIEGLAAAKAVLERLGEEPRRARRTAALQRGLVGLFVTDAVHASARSIARTTERHGATDRESWRRSADRIPAACVGFTAETERMFHELKAFIYRFVINHQEVNRQDHRARQVMTGLFRAFWDNPLTLPTYALLAFHEASGRPYLRDMPFADIPAEVASHYRTDARFARVIVDHLAGMSDRYALQEYEALYHPQVASVMTPGRS